MSALTESFRMLDMTASALVAGAMAEPNRPPMAMQATAVALPVPVELEPLFPGHEILDRLSRALTRPSKFRRTPAEEMAEERLNAITHGLGLVLAVAAVAYLLGVAARSGRWPVAASCGVYGGTLVMMYAASTSLHAGAKSKWKGHFQLCDHVSIYLLIAGTYTPFLAVVMRGAIGYMLLAAVWLLAAVGIAIKMKNAHRLGETSPLPCLALGWLILAAIKPLFDALPVDGIALLVAGGVSYSIGMLFYCRDDKRYFHAIWHLLVIAGTGFHFAAVVLYVA